MPEDTYLVILRGNSCSGKTTAAYIAGLRKGSKSQKRFIAFSYGF